MTSMNWSMNAIGCVLVLLNLVAPLMVSALENGLASVPPMGWNSWNSFNHHVTEHDIINAAKRIKELELDQLGYVYINIDDCWSDMERTPTGELRGDPVRFPSDMAWMGKHLHDLGLKFGIYSSAGTQTCAGFPASLGKEDVDATTFARWGVDFLKYDNCHNQGLPSLERFVDMRNALNATGRPIVYSICQWGHESPWQWAPEVGHSWRADGDMGANWRSIKHSFHTTMEHFERAGPGAWLDPDMLQVGNGKLQVHEHQAHFSLWALIKAPLLLGNDLMSMSDEILKVITNPYLISWHQDPHTPIATRRHARTHFDNGEDEYAVYAATRTESKDIDSIKEVVAIMINWGEFSEPAHTLDVCQILGLTPFPDEVVFVQNWYTGDLLQPLNASNGDGALQFKYKDLKEVPVPELLQHDSIVYKFTLYPKDKAPGAAEFLSRNSMQWKHAKQQNEMTHVSKPVSADIDGIETSPTKSDGPLRGEWPPAYKRTASPV